MTAVKSNVKMLWWITEIPPKNAKVFFFFLSSVKEHHSGNHRKVLRALVLLIYSLKYVLCTFKFSVSLRFTFYEVIGFSTVNFIWLDLLFHQVPLRLCIKLQTCKMDKNEDDVLLYRRVLCFVKGLNAWLFIHSENIYWEFMWQTPFYAPGV